MLIHEHTTRTKRLGAAAAKPLLVLAVLVGAIVLAGAASAQPTPSIAVVSPSGSVCPGTVLTLTSYTSPPGYPNHWGFAPDPNETGTLMAHFQLGTGARWDVIPFNTIIAPYPWTGQPDVTHVTVPIGIYPSTSSSRAPQTALSFTLWLDMTDGWSRVSKGASVQISILSPGQCGPVNTRGPLPVH